MSVAVLEYLDDISLDVRSVSPLVGGCDPLAAGLSAWTVTAHLDPTSPAQELLPPCRHPLTTEQAGGLPQLGCPGVIAELHLMRVDLTVRAPAMARLRACDDDAGDIGAALLDRRTGRLRPRVIKAVGPADAVLLLVTAQLVPSFTGFGLGPLLAGVSMQQLRAGCDVAATHPAPIVSRSALSYAQACRALGKVWEQVGFTAVPGGVHVLDLRGPRLDVHVAAIRQRLRTAPPRRLAQVS